MVLQLSLRLTKEEIFFNEQLSCADCGVSYPEISPRTFSFNSPYGACPTCSGLGTIIEFDPELIIADENLTINEGAIAPLVKYRISIHQPSS